MDPRAFLAALATKCPAYREHLPDCTLRVLSPDAGNPPMPAPIAALDDGAVDELVRGHFLCLCRKNGCGID